MVLGTATNRLIYISIYSTISFGTIENYHYTKDIPLYLVDADIVDEEVGGQVVAHIVRDGAGT